MKKEIFVTVKVKKCIEEQIKKVENTIVSRLPILKEPSKYKHGYG